MLNKHDSVPKKLDMAQIKKLNHAVLFVSDVDRSAAFYKKVFGMKEVGGRPGQAVFMRAPGSDNHHDLAVMSVGPRAQRPPQYSTGLYHLAWEVETIDELAEALGELAEANALVGMSDHGVSKSLYGRDPDGIEFEVLWSVPREDWGELEHSMVTQPLDLAKELARYGRRAVSAS
jgi:catechol-2,3-dioxygenase